MLWLRAGVDAVSTMTNRSREPVALALARAPPWARARNLLRRLAAASPDAEWR
mgnify:CR=1 FL=1